MRKYFFTVPPRWVIEPSDISAVSGRPAKIDCQADGVPLPHVRWKVSSGKLFSISLCQLFFSISTEIR